MLYFGLVLLALTILSHSTQASVIPNRQWKNSLKPKGQSEEVLLANSHHAFYRVVLPNQPSSQEQKAADDLVMWLKEMSGAAFGITSSALYSNRNGHYISIGKTDQLLQSGSQLLRRKLDDEAYGIDVINGNIYLTGGKTRGIINVVYALLEEDLGCRWYSRSTQTLPSADILKAKITKRTYGPSLDIRDPYYWNAFEGTWSLRNRTNSPNAAVPIEWGGNQSYALFVHTFSTLVPADKYFKDHPEYFSEHNGQRDPGQLCVTNPDVVKVAADTCIRILRKHPEAKIISVSQNDSVPCCDCQVCRSLTEKEGSKSGPLLVFVNAVADEVAKQYPDVKISTLAYLDTFMPPKTIRPHKNVVIQLCTDSHAWSYPFQFIEQTQKYQTAHKGWSAIGAAIYVWDYTVNFSHYAGPNPNWQVVTDSIRFFTSHNTKGVMLQGNYQGPGTADGDMRCWVWAKQLWNPKLDTLNLMRDFVYGYYGKSAEPIWKYEMLLWDMWKNEHNGKLKEPAGGIRYSMSLFDRAFLNVGYRLMDDAKRLATEEETLHRVEEVELQLLYAELEQTAKPDNTEDFSSKIDTFERIGRRINMDYTREGGPDFDDFVARMKAKITK